MRETTQNQRECDAITGSFWYQQQNHPPDYTAATVLEYQASIRSTKHRESNTQKNLQQKKKI